jgi:hypothetical protein
LLNILINIILPVLILNKGSKFLHVSPTVTVALALSLPLGYGIYDYIRSQKLNIFSGLGFVNILVTGVLVVMNLGGMWFAAKEAFFPLLIGIAVAASAYTQKPFIKTLIYTPKVFNIDRINQEITSRNANDLFQGHLKNSTLFLSVSFLVSALLNFALAIRVFKPLEGLDEIARQETLNSQIADMHIYSTFVIMIPMMIFLIAILFYFIKGLTRITQIKSDDLMKS